MTTTCSNFTPAQREQALRAFKGVRVKHPRIGELFEELDVYLAPCSGADIVLLLGPTGVGKSTATIAMLESTYREQAPAMADDPSYVPAIWTEAPSAGERAFSWRLFYGAILEQLNEPLVGRKLDVTTSVPTQLKQRSGPDKKMLSGLRISVERALKERRTRYVVVDEAVHILRQASARELPVHMDTLKSLANICDVTFVLVGSYDLFEVLRLNAQLARRVQLVHFSRYRGDNPGDRKAFAKTVRALVDKMPITGEVNLQRWTDTMFEHSVGCVGILKDILQRALTAALIHHGEWKDVYLERALPTAYATRAILQDIIHGEELLSNQGLNARVA